MDISNILQFKQDREFSKLLHHDNYVDLTTAALELARDDQPDLKFDPVYTWIQQRAAELSGRVALANDDQSTTLHAISYRTPDHRNKNHWDRNHQIDIRQ